jgi:hypothetical protein
MGEASERAEKEKIYILTARIIYTMDESNANNDPEI